MRADSSSCFAVPRRRSSQSPTTPLDQGQRRWREKLGECREGVECPVEFAGSPRHRRVPALDVFEDQDDPTPLAFVVGEQKPGHGRILGQRGGDPGLPAMGRGCQRVGLGSRRLGEEATPVFGPEARGHTGREPGGLGDRRYNGTTKPVFYGRAPHAPEHPTNQTGAPPRQGGLDAVILVLYLRAALSQPADPDHGLPTHRRRGATVHAGVDRYAHRRSLATPEAVDDLRLNSYAGGDLAAGPGPGTKFIIGSLLQPSLVLPRSR